MELLLLFLLFLIFNSLLRRFLKNPAGSLINPLFYLLAFSTLYLLVPLLYIDFALTVVDIDIPVWAVKQAFGWSMWYVVIFYLFYLFSSDINCVFSGNCINHKLIKPLFIVYIFLSLVMLYIVLRYAPSVYAIKSDRGAALLLYETYVNGPFKLRILMYLHLVTIFMLFWRYKKYLYLSPCLLYLILDNSHGGRTVSFMILCFVYFLIVVKEQKTYLKYAICIVISFVFVGLLQRSTSSDLMWNLYMSGAEFSNTYLTTLYLLSHPDYLLDGDSYFFVSLSKILPGGIVDKILGFGEWYGNQLSDDIGLGYGLSGNIMTEALVYGGKLFCFFNPLFIGLFCFLLNRNNHRRTLFFVLYTLLFCISMQNVVRSYFWGFALYPLQFLLFFFFWLKSEYSKLVFGK